ncbi:hypothetical protein EJ05DRAFT_478044 [Pseudovirgaria hyperparasitica]|uniref:Ubiquitin-like domain-containing protein n=1 Tax=Pseudovirgaria hyperparasitica TaxID=470096 RepID=A0A6A6W331_9PEZI|nr:uncharacterized protein EJ05DRAFT_478044 [Pseudovirgaria hyperparasitica]KAF2755997.1 hypothetical protein EJ05DRAFT_478044 [Pseudovirgaria hyperparasitica]
MSEEAFAKSFIDDLARLPVTGPKVLSAPSPSLQYMLPKHPTTPQKRKRTTSSPDSSSSSTITITLKPRKDGAELSLPAQPLTTSIYDLKAAYAAHTGYPVDKFKLLNGMKPETTGSKTVAEIFGLKEGEDAKDVEFKIMLMAGATAQPMPDRVVSPPVTLPVDAKTDVTPAVRSPDEAPVAQGLSGEGVMHTEKFWGDLKGWLIQRIRDEKEGERLAGLFRVAWEKASA